MSAPIPGPEGHAVGHQPARLARRRPPPGPPGQTQKVKALTGRRAGGRPACSPPRAAGPRPGAVLGLVDGGLAVLDAHADGEGLGLHGHARCAWSIWKVSRAEWPGASTSASQGSSYRPPWPSRPATAGQPRRPRTVRPAQPVPEPHVAPQGQQLSAECVSPRCRSTSVPIWGLCGVEDVLRRAAPRTSVRSTVARCGGRGCRW